MRLEQILTEQVTQQLFHATSMNDAVSAIQQHKFILSHHADGSDGMRTDAPSGKVNYYFLSTARSTRSAYFDDMLTHADVIIVLSGSKLGERNKVKPYVDQNARHEMGNDYNEMEERIFSSSKILTIPSPINQTILSVHCMDIQDPKVYQSINNSYVQARCSPQIFQMLKEVCARNSVPLITYQRFDRFRLLRP